MRELDLALQAQMLGHPTVRGGLTMFPLLGPGLDDPGYMTLDAALAAGAARITEVSASGSVPELLLRNSGTLPVFLMDGEELVGAKQNRVLNLSMLCPPLADTKIPVSCVESGRWSHVSPTFAAAPRAHFAAGRAHRAESVSFAIMSCGVASSDQSEVWADISDKAERMDAQSSTSAMEAIFHRHSGHIAGIAHDFRATPGQTGALFAIGDRITGVDLFDSETTLACLLPKIVQSWVLDALDYGDGLPGVQRPAAMRFLHEVSEAPAGLSQSTGMGEDLRFTGSAVVGGALVAWGRVVHLCAFGSPAAAAQPAEVTQSAVLRPSARRMGRFRA